MEGDRAEVLRTYHRAILLTRMTPDGARFRIAPDPVSSSYLSRWCKTEARAWHAAACRIWHKTYSKESW